MSTLWAPAFVNASAVAKEYRRGTPYAMDATAKQARKHPRGFEDCRGREYAWSFRDCSPESMRKISRIAGEGRTYADAGSHQIDQPEKDKGALEPQSEEDEGAEDDAVEEHHHHLFGDLEGQIRDRPVQSVVPLPALAHSTSARLLRLYHPCQFGGPSIRFAARS